LLFVLEKDTPTVTKATTVIPPRPNRHTWMSALLDSGLNLGPFTGSNYRHSLDGVPRDGQANGNPE
jgi:hypothetical protein